MGFVSGTVCAIERIWPLVILFWIGMLTWGCIEGPTFFTNTDNAVQATKGTPSYEAERMMNQFFPKLAVETPWLMVIQCDPEVIGSCAGDDFPVISDGTATFVNSIQDSLFALYPDIFLVEETQSFFRFDNTTLDSLKFNHISADGLTTYVMWQATRDVPQANRYEAYHKLRSLVKASQATYCPGCYIGITGADALTDDTTGGVAETIARADAFIVPFAAFILIYMIGSWRLVLITLFNIATVILSAFAIMNKVSAATTKPQSITPQFVEVIAMAITIDYSLFFFTRFVKELDRHRKLWHKRRNLLISGGSAPSDDSLAALSIPAASKEEDAGADDMWAPEAGCDRPMRGLVRVALMGALRHSGHVIFVSGTTLLVSFLGFFLSNSQFLIQPAIANAIAISISMLISVTAPIALISGFPAFFTNFNLWPDWCYWLCCPTSRQHALGDVDYTGDEAEADDPYEESYNATLAAVEHERMARDVSFSVAASRDRNRLIGYDRGMGFRGSSGDSSDREQMYASTWFRMGRLLVQRPWNFVVLALVFAGLGAFAIHIKDMELSSSYSLGIPTDSPAKHALETLQAAFNPGLVQPFNALVVFTPPAGGVPAESVEEMLLDVGCQVIDALKEHVGLEYRDMVSPFYYKDEYIRTKARAMELIFSDDVYKLIWSQQMSPTAPPANITTPVSSRINIVLPFFTEDLGNFLPSVRNKAFSAVNRPDTVSLHLAGYKASEIDTIEAAKDTFPLMLSVTTAVVLIIVAVLLRSAFVPVRLLLTLIFPMAATFGLAVLVYQKGILDWTGIPAFAAPEAAAFYWDIPIFAFVVLLGLALDYDVFIISRIAEFREKGYRNSAAIVLGLYETGPIITAAGIIMALSFAALMTLKSAAAHQTGWLLISSVLIDTFVVRSLIVPCVMAFADTIGWWPREVPTTNLMDIDGSRAEDVGSTQYGTTNPY